MKLNGIFILLFSAVSFQTASAQTLPDSMWLFKDSIPAEFQYYYEIGLCDTQIGTTGCFVPVDTGDAYNGKYINFDYQFTNGYAGFKIFWDMGMVQWDATGYDTMYLVHKGPLPGHKVRMVWGRSPGYGSPFTYQVLGEFKSSTAWKKETIPFPPGFSKTGIFELRMLIGNDSGTTNPASGPGDLKIDDIAFVKAAPPGMPVTPELLNPADNSTTSGTTSAYLSWGTTSSATSYEAQVSKYSNFSTLIIDSTLAMGGLTAWPLSSGTSYYWRIRSKNTAGASTWSATWKFTTSSSTTALSWLADSSPEMSSVQKAGSATIAVKLPSMCSKGAIAILSISGKKLAERVISGPGPQTITFTNVPTGVHILRLDTGGKTIMREALNF